MEIFLLQLRSSVWITVLVVKTSFEGENKVSKVSDLYTIQELVEIPCVTKNNKMQNISSLWPVLLLVD